MRLEHRLPNGIMKQFFLAYAAVELHHHSDTVAQNRIDQLSVQFPNSRYLLAQRGISFYNHRRKLFCIM
jgi:hypothetical protein